VVRFCRNPQHERPRPTWAGNVFSPAGQGLWFSGVLAAGSRTARGDPGHGCRPTSLTRALERQNPRLNPASNVANDISSTGKRAGGVLTE